MTEGQRVTLMRLTSVACPELKALIDAVGTVEEVRDGLAGPLYLVRFDAVGLAWLLKADEIEVAG